MCHIDCNDGLNFQDKNSIVISTIGASHTEPYTFFHIWGKWKGTLVSQQRMNVEG